MVREQLQKETDASLDDYKKQLKQLIADCYDTISEEREQEQLVPPYSQKKPRAASKPAKKRAAGEEDSKVVKKKKKPVRNEETLQKNPFTRSWALSSALADVTGVTELSRPGVVKALWQYIKKNELQDPSNKSFIVCDDKLKAIFDGQDRIHCFTMNKHIGKHLNR
ncbi:hypothetical protein DFQ28_011538 [Apophysomyces sp. BC1034]|nr:hypothetical protein DFQ29_006067 [Apophysomyces sp. BC1021]KAG0191562.1 hypothetical protein DFQ28_011538 [Apophysomyces sp. BC1034]